jgi:hypothetical protein
MTTIAADARAPVAPATGADAHDLPLPGGRWRVWTTAALRGAGFPASLVAALASPRAAAAANAYRDAQAETRGCLARMIGELNAESRDADPEQRARLRARRRRLKKGIVDPGGGASALAAACATTAEAAAYARFVAAYAHDGSEGEDAIGRILSDPRFQEAALWQNHRAFATARQTWRHGRSARDRRAAGHYLAMLVQRYAVKNDSIGFFGPVGWLTLSAAPIVVEVTPGPELLARREVYFESWAIDALVDRLNQERALRPWMVPRIAAGVWLDAEGAYVPLRGRVALDERQRRLLLLCDGVRSGREIATRLADDPRSELRTESEAFDLLDGLVRSQVVVWRLEVPRQLRPERELARRLARIGDPAIRARCEDALASIVGARDAVARAAGRPDDLEACLAELDAAFTAQAARPAVRRAGQTYAARGLVYEDCRRDCAVTLGAEFLSALGPPLSIVFDAALWTSTECARVLRGELRRCHAALRGRAGNGAVDGHLFYTFVQMATRDTLASLLADVSRRLSEKWRSILQLDVEASRVVRAVDEVAALAGQAFAIDGEPWSPTGYFGPDLMVAADGLDAFQRGEFHIVLGEMHCTNTLLTSALASQHPDLESLRRAIARDGADRQPILTQIAGPDWMARLDAVVTPPGAWRYEFGDDPPQPGDGRSLPAAMLVAADDGETVMMRARDGSLAFDALDLFVPVLCRPLTEALARGLTGAPHTPRITIGRLTVAREEWTTTPETMGFVDERDDGRRFAAVRQWAEARRLPRHVFIKAPSEVKPCYVDFDSTTYVELFARMMRRAPRAAPVRIVEMLPTPADTWLIDSAGRRYTVELRLAARRPRAAADLELSYVDGCDCRWHGVKPSTSPTSRS